MFSPSLSQIGIVLAVEAAVAITEVVEMLTAAAETGEVIAGAAEAGEAIDAGASAGSEAGAEACGEALAGLEAGGEALEQVLSKFSQVAEKVAKMVDDYIKIDAVFKTAKAIIQAITYDPSTHKRFIKLGKLISVLTQSAKLMKTLSDWLKKNASNTVKVNEYIVPLQGVLSKFISKLGAVSLLLVIHAECS